MILTKTPYRISLFGGGTDYPEWYRDHGGKVVGMAINKYCYLAVKDSPAGQGFKFRVAYRHVEDCHSMYDIKHPGAIGVLRGMKWDSERGIEIVHTGDLPAMGGMGASSSYVVGLTAALHGLLLRPLPEPAALAAEAVRIERDVIKEAVGVQDQHFAAYGGLRTFEFLPHKITTRTLNVSEGFIKEFESWLVLAFTGQMRFAHMMAQKIVDNVASKDSRVHAAMRKLFDLAVAGEAAFMSEDIDRIADLLRFAWACKKATHSEISNVEIEFLYNRGLHCGAVAGKLLGAGGGGFMLFMVPPVKRDEFIRDIGVPCTKIRISDPGSQIIVNEP